jgi:hypothetical protein
MSQVVVGRRQRLQVFGGDYLTAHGSGVLDYIHMKVLARGSPIRPRHLAHRSSPAAKHYSEQLLRVLDAGNLPRWLAWQSANPHGFQPDA